MTLKFVGKELPGRQRTRDAELETLVAALKDRPGEWAEASRSPLGIYRDFVLRRYRKWGLEAQSRRDPATNERVYYARWPENGSDGSGD